MTDLFTPFELGELALPNRILMSAMTRTRAGEDGVPTDLMRDYYVQRASAGLIVTECTQVSDQGHGIIRCPGLHREDQVAGWRKVTDAVHAAGGRIVCQIWHCGRVAHLDMRGGEPPVAPSPIPATGDFFLPSGRVDSRSRASFASTRSPASSRASRRRPGTRARPVSTASNCTGPTATCRTNSCRTAATSAVTLTAARW